MTDSSIAPSTAVVSSSPSTKVSRTPETESPTTKIKPVTTPPPKTSTRVADTFVADAITNSKRITLDKPEPPESDLSSTQKEGQDNREVMVTGDIVLFEAWFEVMEKNADGKVNVEVLVDKLASSGLFIFNHNPTNLARKMEEKAMKEELLDLIEEDLSLNVLGWISINQFFRVIVRFPRYLYRLRRAAGDVRSPPKVWEKPEPLTFEQKEEAYDIDAGIMDPFDDPKEDKSTDKQSQRVSWRNSFKDLFAKSSGKLLKKKKKNPKRLSKQSSSFYDKCCSVRRAFLGKKSEVKVYSKDTDEEDEHLEFD